MRPAIVLVTLLAFGCSSLRYSSRTEMVEVAPAAPAPTELQQTSPAARRHHRRLGFVIGGTIASLVGAGLIVGGAVGWHRQSAANDEADAECAAKGGWFCGLFDELSYMPYGFMLGFGTAATLTGIVLLGLGANENERP